MLCVSKIETPNIGWLSCNGFGLQCSNPKPNYNPTPNEYTYNIYIYIYIHSSIWVHDVLKLHQKNPRTRATKLGEHTFKKKHQQTHVQY